MASPGVELWQSFVDTFAGIGDGVHRCWIMERVNYPDFEVNRDINDLLKALTEAQREVLTKMLIQARHGGVFDTLAVLHDRLALNDGKYIEKAIEMAFEPHGYTLYEDFNRRQAGDPWIYSEASNKSPERTRGE
jgi:hypothetical protein